MILDQAKLVESNLIVLGAHGIHSEEGEIGSVAADLIQRSVCPVFLVPVHVSEDAVDERIESVLTYVSLSHVIQPLIVFSLRIAELFGARLDILVLKEGPDQGEDDPTVQKLEKRLWEIVAEESRREKSPVPFVDVRLHVGGADGPKAVLDFARERHADIISLNAPGLVAMDAPAERNTEKIVNEAPCPVLVVNACGKAMTENRHRFAPAAVAG